MSLDAIDDGIFRAMNDVDFAVEDVLGSRRNNDARRERLRQFDVSEAQAAALHGPAGLNLGGKTPPEIALAILAEMTALRRGKALGAALSDWGSSTTACRIAA